jgi:methanogenic corrinoid protein MtbC1
VNQNFAQDIGADGYAKDAAEAIDLVRRLIR